MKAIVVVFVPTPQFGISAAKHPLQPRMGLTVPEINDGAKAPLREKAKAPYWTWFIENPRVYRGAMSACRA
jgi:hypothetical protein